MLIYRIIKYVIIGFVGAALSGCFGGSIAQQVVRSILLRGADKATAVALDVDSPNRQPRTQNIPYQTLPPDRYSIAFLNSGFAPVALNVEPLPAAATAADLDKLQASKLVEVEIWSLLVGAEKQHVLEKAAQLGMPGIPAQADWRQWRVAIGASAHNKQSLTFLIPPDMTGVYSGGKAWVELTSAGDLNMARYTLP